LKRIVSENGRAAAAKLTGELDVHLFSTKTVRELHKSNIHGRAAIAKLWLLRTTLKGEIVV
jgi:hypothetical protein